MVKVGDKVMIQGNQYPVYSILAPTSQAPLYDIIINNAIYRLEGNQFESVISNSQLLLFW